MSSKYEWCVVGDSVTGASHIRAGTPNQDYLKADQGPPSIMAVSDGHGSPLYFRSHFGARRAAEDAIKTLNEVAAKIEDSGANQITVINRFADEYLPQHLVKNWTASVERDRKQTPFSFKELKKLVRAIGISRAAILRENPSAAYGATLLCVMITHSYILYIQLGDGDIVVVDDDGEVYRPIEKPENLIGNETTSLCGTDAWKDVQVYVQKIQGRPPALIMLSTDGYVNSFRDDEGFLKVGPDILKLLQEYGIEYIKSQLCGWLDEASGIGSGDDVTLGMIIRLDQPDEEK